MTGTALLALIALGTVGGAHLLSKARWTWTMPRAGIALWQALGLAWGVATIGALLGYALLPYGQGITGGIPAALADGAARMEVHHLAALLSGVGLTVVLLAVLVYALVRMERARRRHRALLELVAGQNAAVPGTLVLDHPAAAAYCVPGVRSSKVVVSAGTLELLDADELAAVLAHERAHARERHDLVLLPFASLRHAFPQIRLVDRCLDAVELLIEMAADDRARRHRSPRELATALLRFAAARPVAAPSGALSVAGDQPAVLARVDRLLRPTPPHRGIRAATLIAIPLLAVVPFLLYHLPV
ncbi:MULTISPECIES: M56 family metallopeptidase [Thermomonospora]|mgnify:CR=1 FL=1|uniref:Peptidase M48 Ste24p n=1 Tax=Thermomonospora curvata (strain ATCC 19995 / DSM 43183 / JCM 3096 / KCTC 9072 / NBRC 15933 / NCIMB 10081 / Henssen B9) TaxID=471852 RepID=D1A4P3_THECD|nr:MULTISPECIES: M56 family metallopeptidase [Thermomonospora]ACY96278.1 peptidase M48 Ste24p [Thermomonospora curvata DSM 43183]PKK15696.1 MAG: peptidase M48 Ste24p [Thermomonospora sp. CIF 1]